MLTDDPFVSIDLSLSVSGSGEYDEEDDHLSRYHGVIKGEYDNDKPVVIGSCEALQVRLDDALGAGLDYFTFFDLDSSLLEMGSVLLDDFEEVSLGLLDKYSDHFIYLSEFLIIERLEISPEYRGKGYGISAIHLLLKHLKGAAELAILKAFPLQFENEGRLEQLTQQQKRGLQCFDCTREQAQDKLTDYYSMAGFELFGGNGFMIKPF